MSQLISRTIGLGHTESLIEHSGSLLKVLQKLSTAEAPQSVVNTDLNRLTVGPGKADSVSVALAGHI